MEKKNKFVKKDWVIVWGVSLIHLLLSGTYRLFFYQYDSEGLRYFEFPVAREKNIMSIASEKIMSMSISGIMGSILILIIWYVLIRALKERRKGVFVIIVCSMVLTFILFPVCFMYQKDTIELYYNAVTNRPDYWHNFYTTCIYNACLLVFPQAFMMTLIQMNAFLGVLYYLSLRYKKIYEKKAGYFVWLIILMPGILELASNSYRNCINTIMCMALMAVLFCDMLQNRKRSGKELIFMCFAGSFLAVFRNEQILFILILAAAFYYIYKNSVRQSVVYLVMMIFISLVMILPQKIGEIKYFGKDYAMINQMETMGLMLRENSMDLSYTSAEEDIQNFDRIVPLEKIKKSGIWGYDGHLYATGGSYRQTFAQKEQQKQFLKAVNSMILHNVPLFLKARLQLFMEAGGIVGKNSKILTDEISEAGNAQNIHIQIGQSQMRQDTFLRGVLWTDKKLAFGSKILYSYQRIWDYIGIYGGILVIWIMVFMLFALMGNALYKEKMIDSNKKKFLNFVTIMLYAQLAGIFLLGPEGRSPYYYPVFFEMLIGVMSLMIYYRYSKKQIKSGVVKNQNEDIR